MQVFVAFANIFQIIFLVSQASLSILTQLGPEFLQGSVLSEMYDLIATGINIR